jgi:hypothetical protein
LLIGGRLGPDGIAAIAAVSPAPWHDAGDMAAGAFDDAEDFAVHTVFGKHEQLTGMPVRNECGTSDPFSRGHRRLCRRLEPDLEGGFQRGGHDVDYWRRDGPGAAGLYR